MDPRLTLVLGLLAALLMAWALPALFLIGLERHHVRRSGYRPDLEAAGPARRQDVLVILVHGTLYPAPTMRTWRARLEEAGLETWLYEYRYLHRVEENCRLLERHTRERLEKRPGPPPGRIVVIGYSQGGMLLRWLLAGHGKEDWLRRVVGMIQVAAPNLGAEVAGLERWTFPPLRREGALAQLTPGSPFLQELRDRPLPAGLGVGMVYGLGTGQHFLERLVFGRLVESPIMAAVGGFYERWKLPAQEHDGLVPTASALALYELPGMEDQPAPRQVVNDHLGLMEDPEVGDALVELTERFLR